MSYKEETKSTNMFFKSAIVVALLGVMLYFIQEIVLWTMEFGMDPPHSGFRILTLICDAIAIIGILLIVIFMLIGKDNQLIFRIAALMGALYLLSYILSIFLYPFDMTGSWEIPSYYNGNVLEFYKGGGLSFISLLITGAYCVYLIVLASISFGKEEISILESFSTILMFALIFVFDNSNVHFPRALIFSSLTTFYGLFFIPLMVELFLLVGVIILLTLKIANADEKITNILGLVFINIFFVAMISTTVISSGFNFEYVNSTPFIIGNFLIIIGTILIMISSALKVKKEIL